jgi:hypothetical protein
MVAGAPVLLFHRVAMAGALLAPLRRATVCEAHGDERGAQIMSADAQAIL